MIRSWPWFEYSLVFYCYYVTVSVTYAAYMRIFLQLSLPSYSNESQKIFSCLKLRWLCLYKPLRETVFVWEFPVFCCYDVTIPVANAGYIRIFSSTPPTFIPAWITRDNFTPKIKIISVCKIILILQTVAWNDFRLGIPKSSTVMTSLFLSQTRVIYVFFCNARYLHTCMNHQKYFHASNWGYGVFTN